MLASLLAASLTLSACTPAGDDAQQPGSTSSPDAAQQFNDADIEFAQLMLPHHEGAIDMAQVILDKEDIDPRVTDLAKRIQAAQGPEIDQLGEWLDAWDANTGMSGMDHGMGGMASEDDMAAMDAATGVTASQLFLEQMTIHHQGAIVMSETELDDGENPDALAMAQNIIDAQESEIAEMQQILSTL